MGQVEENTANANRVVPTTRKGKQTYGRQLDAARQVFAREGFAETTMSAVAEEAQVSLGGLYRYFTDKDDLFMAVIEGIHEELYESSGAPTHNLADAPYAALRDSNLGYLQYYKANSGLMRTFMEAATREPQFRDFWWYMRNRHINRFMAALRVHYGIGNTEIERARQRAEAAACMAEHCAYVWFAQDALRTTPVSVEDAADIVTHCWYTMFFGEDFATPKLVLVKDSE